MKAESSDEMREFYEREYDRGLGIASIPQDDDFMYGQVLTQIRPYLHPGTRVLDLGCNTGNLSLYMARAGCEVLGIDIAKNAVAAAVRSARYYGISNAQFERMDFLQDWQEADVFDFILCSHVLEHVRQEDLFLKKIAFALKPCGWLLLMTPTKYSSVYLSNNLVTDRFAFDEEVGHLRRYTTQTMISVVEGANLQINKIVFLDSVLRDWFIVFEPLRRFNRIWRRRHVRSVFNCVDMLLARFLFPATVCVHAQRI